MKLDSSDGFLIAKKTVFHQLQSVFCLQSVSYFDIRCSFAIGTNVEQKHIFPRAETHRILQDYDSRRLERQPSLHFPSFVFRLYFFCFVRIVWCAIVSNFMRQTKPNLQCECVRAHQKRYSISFAIVVTSRESRE